MSRDCASRSVPCMPGIRWSLITMARASPLAFSSRIVARPSSPDEALTIVYDSRYRLRRSRRTAASTCGSSSTTSIAGLFTATLSRGLRDRQRHAELGSPRRTLDLDIRVIVLDQALHDFQAEAGALAHRLGGEERFEQVVEDLRRNARPVVDHPDDDAALAAFSGDVDAAALRNRIERVVDEVRPDLIQLADESARLRQVGRNADGDRGRLLPRL